MANNLSLDKIRAMFPPYCNCHRFPVQNKLDSDPSPWPPERIFIKVVELGSPGEVHKWLREEVGAVAEWKGAVMIFAEHLETCGVYEQD